MPPKVAFYTQQGQEGDEQAYLTLVCRLAHKALLSLEKTYIRAADAKQAQALDELLWERPAHAFVPHARITSETDPGNAEVSKAPVLIGTEAVTAGGCQILINLTAELPPSPLEFARIIEVPFPDDESKGRARERYRYYKDQGWPPEHHNMPAGGGGAANAPSPRA